MRQCFRLDGTVTFWGHPDDVSQQDAPADEVQLPAEREFDIACALINIAPVPAGWVSALIGTRFSVSGVC
jgi:hypothetical protein